MVTPLKKRTEEGQVYRRTAAVEAAIDVALTQDLTTVLEHSTIREPKLPGHLPSECLVYLVREALFQEDAPKYRVLLKMLLDRCEDNLRRHVAENAFPDAEALRTEILADFSNLFVENWAQPDLTDLDFFEVRFNSAFAKFRIDRVRAELKRIAPLKAAAGRRASDSPVGSTVSEDEILSTLSVTDGLENRSPHQLDFREGLLDAINSLPPDEREAISLCYLLGYEIESDDPAKPTASSVAGVVGRTIRNRLARGIKTLQKIVK